MSESVHPTQDLLPSHLSSANQNPSANLPCPYPYLFLYPYLVHHLFLSNHPIRVFLALLVAVVHSLVHTDSFRNPVRQTDQDSRKDPQDLQGKPADEEVTAQVEGTVVVDAGAMVEAKVLVQVVGVGQYLVGTVGMVQGVREVREVEVRSSRVAVDHVHSAAGG